MDNRNELIPIVRTTSPYTSPAQSFKEIHCEIINKIKEIIPNIELNNAMIEIYNCEYKTMKYHSDQSLDLAEDSYICIFSCYSNPESKSLRKLKIKEKGSDVESEIILKHNSVVIFSTELNNKVLRIANPEEKREFMKMKGMENQLTDFTYPDIDFTVSPSDLMKVL